MARIDDLLNHVADADLRKQLGTAVGEIRDRRQFGIVYESHIPETVALSGMSVKRGSSVLTRKRMSGDPLFVESINGKTALLSCPKARNKISANIEDLMVVKPFGEAIFPCLTLVGKLYRGNGPAAHSVISAENYHALQLLVYMYEAKMDCIYIDPPYNTGASDWTYNNRFVDSNDSYRHSKWLSFIEKRLRLAKRLLKPDGVLVITVDEHEVHHLGMLLEKISLIFSGR
jgi:adenine-specific DNA-methyltransferase